jgi:hypothetical protein
MNTASLGSLITTHAQHELKNPLMSDTDETSAVGSVYVLALAHSSMSAAELDQTVNYVYNLLQPIRTSNKLLLTRCTTMPDTYLPYS